MARSRGGRLAWGLALVVLASSSAALAHQHEHEHQYQHQHEAFHDAAAGVAAGEAGQHADVWSWLVNPRRDGDGAASRSTQLHHGVEQQQQQRGGEGAQEERGAVEAMLQHIKRNKLDAALRDFQAAQRLGGLDAEQEAMLAQTEEVLRRLGVLASDDANEHALDSQAHQAGGLAQLMNQAHALGQLEDAADAGAQQQHLPSLLAHAHATAAAAASEQRQQRDAATQTDAQEDGQAEPQLRRPATTQFDTFTISEPRGQEGEEAHATLLADMEAARSSSDDEGQQVDAAYMSEYDEAAAAAQAHSTTSSSTGLELAAAQQQQQQHDASALGRLREAQERLASLPWTLLGAQRMEDARDPMAQQQQWEREEDGGVAPELDEVEAAALQRELDNQGDAQSSHDAVAQAAAALPELAAHLLRGMMLRHQQQHALGASSSSSSSAGNSRVQEVGDAYADDLPDAWSGASVGSVGEAEEDGGAFDYEQEAAAVRDALLLGPFAFVRRFVESVVGGLGRALPAATTHSRVLVLPGQRVLVLHSRHYDDDGGDAAEPQWEDPQQQQQQQQQEGEGDPRLTLTGASDDPLFSSGGWVGQQRTRDAATDTQLELQEEEEEEERRHEARGGGAWVQPHLWSGGPAHTWHGLMPHRDEEPRDREQQEAAEAERGQDLASLYLSLFHGMRRAEQHHHHTAAAAAAHEQQQQESALLQRYLEQQQQQVAGGTLEAQQEQQEQQALPDRVLPRVPHEWAGLLEADGSINLGALMLAALLMATLFMLVGFVRSLDSLQGAMAACCSSSSSSSSSAALSGALLGRGGRWADEGAEEGGLAHPLLVPFVVEGSDGALQQGYLWLSEEELRQAAAAAGYQPPAAAAAAAAAVGAGAGGKDDLGKGAAQAAWGAKQADKVDVAAEEEGEHGARHVVVVPATAAEEEEEGAPGQPQRREEREPAPQGVLFARNFVG